MKKLGSKTIIVTGTGRGSGRSIACEMARNRARIVLVATTVEQIEKTESIIRKDGGSAISLPADFADELAVAKMVAKVEEVFGPVDLLMNNAGR